ncbi:precorrin-6y C5,15-methyltransferase (decarboxylating) subunit CbiE [Thermostichus vulcanus]|uniref:Precorrin-6y C5,15-methyltransferase (Decarboxylating) subunit CbiE n=1 Tax=Thermostichus vulcanus str. 'Rupite' TaxID=2813851 RepID=A0ABT0CC13_THEVL|nr:precorrin-6y C5,15-methyltransferase (decarboxylating) subunit CbiE [Thermostichus vulcanus]MCJ2543298.1 precorrin-6y C5,15-methyltransferase (decarboxylating) subunit CbiE [Thermostichus vulcanus str. 'Rupite']
MVTVNPSGQHPKLAVVGVALDGSVASWGIPPLSEAQTLIGVPSLLTHFADHPARKVPLTGAVESWIPLLKQELAQGSLVLLASGDPLFFGIGRLLTEHFPPEQLAFYPQVSSVQLALNRLQIPWQEATILSVHGRGLEQLESILKQGSSPVVVLTDPQHSPYLLAQLIRDLRLPTHYQAWVCSQLGSPQEQIVPLEEGQAQTFPSPNLMVLRRVEREPDPSHWPLVGIPDDQFHTFPDQPGLITKQAIRLLTLGSLQLPQTGVVWDIGAGTGSVAIEMARLSAGLQVYAIERNAMGVRLIERNIERFGLENVQVIAGAAPEVLESLPDPDRVLLGGGGKAMGSLLPLLQARLRPQGVLVANFATLETCSETLQWLRSQGWQVRVEHIQISRSIPLAEGTRFAPLNPVYLLQGIPSSQNMRKP